MDDVAESMRAFLSGARDYATKPAAEYDVGEPVPYASRFARPMDPRGFRKPVYGSAPFGLRGDWGYFLTPMGRPGNALWGMADGQPIHLPDHTAKNRWFRAEDPGYGALSWAPWEDEMRRALMRPLSDPEQEEWERWADPEYANWLETLRADPDDWVSRLTFADWLADRGIDDRAKQFRTAAETIRNYPHLRHATELAMGPPKPPPADEIDHNAPFRREDYARTDYATPLTPADVHPRLRFTRLGAWLLRHANSADDRVALLAREILTHPQSDPQVENATIAALQDMLQDDPDHALARQFRNGGASLHPSFALDQSVHGHLRDTFGAGGQQLVGHQPALDVYRGFRDPASMRFMPPALGTAVDLALVGIFGDNPGASTDALRHALQRVSSQAYFTERDWGYDEAAANAPLEAWHHVGAQHDFRDRVHQELATDAPTLHPEDDPDLYAAPTHYSPESFLQSIAAEPEEQTHRAVFADWLQENAAHLPPYLLNFLRTHRGPAWAGWSPRGVHLNPDGTPRLVAGPRLSWEDLRAANANPHTGDPYAFVQHPSSRGGEHFGFLPEFIGGDAPAYAPWGTPHSGPGGHYFVTHTPEDSFELNPGAAADRAQVWRFNPGSGGISIHSNTYPATHGPNYVHHADEWARLLAEGTTMPFDEGDLPDVHAEERYPWFREPPTQSADPDAPTAYAPAFVPRPMLAAPRPRRHPFALLPPLDPRMQPLDPAIYEEGPESFDAASFTSLNGPDRDYWRRRTPYTDDDWDEADNMPWDAAPGAAPHVPDAAEWADWYNQNAPSAPAAPTPAAQPAASAPTSSLWRDVGPDDGTEEWDPDQPPPTTSGSPAVDGLVQSLFPNARLTNAGDWYADIAGDRSVAVQAVPSANLMLVNFYNTDGDLGATQSASALRRGSLDMIRTIKTLAQAAHAQGMNIGYGTPSDKRRAFAYAQSLYKMGFYPIGRVQGQQAWAPADGVYPEEADEAYRDLLAEIETMPGAERYAADGDPTYYGPHDPGLWLPRFRGLHPAAWRAHPDEDAAVDLTPRFMLADMLGEAGRDREAEILQDKSRHAYLDFGGGVYDAGDVLRQMHSMGGPGPWATDNFTQRYVDEALEHLYQHGLPSPVRPGMQDIDWRSLAAMIADAHHFRAAHEDVPGFTHTSAGDLFAQSRAGMSADEQRRLWGIVGGPRSRPNIMGMIADMGPYLLHPAGGEDLHDLRGPYSVPNPPEPPPPDEFDHNAVRLSRYAGTHYGLGSGPELARALAAVHDDYTGHLVFADWLDENYPALAPLTGRLRAWAADPAAGGMNFGPLPFLGSGAFLGHAGPFRVSAAHPFADETRTIHARDLVQIALHPRLEQQSGIAALLTPGLQNADPRYGPPDHDWAAHGSARPVGFHATLPLAEAYEFLNALLHPELSAAGVDRTAPEDTPPPPAFGEPDFHEYAAPAAPTVYADVRASMEDFLAGAPTAYGPEEDEASFRAAWNAEPLEGTHHAAFADWLDEAGRPDEAAFHRSVGDWLRTRPPTVRAGHERPWMIPGPIGVSHSQYPEGIRGPQRFLLHGTVTDRFGWPIHDALTNDPAVGVWEAGDARYPESEWGTAWPSYDDMLAALRESFLDGLARRRQEEAAQRPPTNAARYAESFDSGDFGGYGSDMAQYDDRGGFEGALDENPFEATTRLAFADWLEEQGLNQESAFQRAFAEWVPSAPFLLPHERGYDSDADAYPWALPGGRSRTDFLPAWASDLPFYWAKEIQAFDPNGQRRPGPDYPGEAPGTPLTRGTGARGRLWEPTDAGGGYPGIEHIGWETFRDMQQAFSDAFHRAHSTGQQPTNAARCA